MTINSRFNSHFETHVLFLYSCCGDRERKREKESVKEICLLNGCQNLWVFGYGCEESIEKGEIVQLRGVYVQSYASLGLEIVSFVRNFIRF